jgi:hypothetical protein
MVVTITGAFIYIAVVHEPLGGLIGASAPRAVRFFCIFRPHKGNIWSDCLMDVFAVAHYRPG